MIVPKGSAAEASALHHVVIELMMTIPGELNIATMMNTEGIDDYWLSFIIDVCVDSGCQIAISNSKYVVASLSFLFINCYCCL